MFTLGGMQVLQTNLTKPTKHFLGGKTKRRKAPRRNRTKYSYDVLGNIKTKDEGSESMIYVYDANNRLSSITGDNARAFTYDERGNVTDNNIHDFVYELSGNMIETTDLSIDYEYDANKRRVKKEDTSQTSYTMYSSSGKMLHKKVGGVTTDYVYAGSLLVAEKTGSTVDYMHTDLLGSPITGSNGTAYKEHYRPWGEKKEGPIQLADDVGFTGHQSDIATGLTYMQARYYDPIVGRFMAVDSVGFTADNPMSFDRFSYANNQPYKYVDPNGESALLAKQTYSPNPTLGRQKPPRPSRPSKVWPVPGHGKLNVADKQGEGDGAFGSPRSGGRSHEGIDIDAPVGAKVVAAADGTVVPISPNPSKSYGNQVVVDHGGGTFSQSAHLDSVTVSPGKKVLAGDQVGTVGRTGNTPKAGDSHLHFEVRQGSKLPSAPVSDPMQFLPNPPP